tara:strand:+ start:1059 stop:1607 length:549 start_codon:yes stop_codon:yes gene_type:complete
MADKVRFAVSVTPIEDVGASQQGGASNYISASECFAGGGNGEVGGSGDSLTGITIESSGAVEDGYLNGAPAYRQATAVADGSAVAMPSLANVGFVYFKHTGFQYSSTTTLSSTANTADLLTIIAGSTVIARLASGEAIVLPVRETTNLNSFKIASTDGTNVDTTAGDNDIAMEYMAFAATGP